MSANKLVLIDGNSLLNRAFYAMNVFSTKDGRPTNGIFGFMKLIFKIIETDMPTHLAVAFDVHAPTFRHKMYEAYKATRKPMPEDLVVQVPVLKELLAAMNIYTVELAGFEADDLIGTLSRKFDDTDVLIYTGDRDSYQLVNDHVTVCFTKKGVTELDILTAENFVRKVGIRPDQIVDEKMLMGDVSDNIPGINGIGPKIAVEMLQKYETVEGVYQHLDDFKYGLKSKLLRGKPEFSLTRELARIRTDVPIDTTLEECRLILPFPEAGRKYFAKLEFRSLVDSEYFVGPSKTEIEVIECTETRSILPLIDEGITFAFCIENGECHIFMGGTEYFFRLRQNFLEPGFFFAELAPVLSKLFSGDKTALVYDVKGLCHSLDDIGVKISCRMEDVSLLRYLGDSNLRQLTPSLYVKDYALPASNCAYALSLAYEDAKRRTDGTAEERLYRELEHPLIFVLLDMERTGVRVDTDKFPEFSEKFNSEMASLSDRIYELAGIDNFNINSPYQLSEVLFEKLGIEPKGAKKNSRGGYSTSADILEKLAPDHEIVRAILRYRELQKLQSTYIDGIRPLVVSGIVHTTYNQTATTTGRLSSANPNLQNIPIRTHEGRELRKLFLAREGNILIDADYSQIELRLLAHFSGCKALIDAYAAGEDIHAATASRVFNVPASEVTPEQRRRAKTINFGIIYGMSRFGLARDLNCSAQEAQDFIDRYFNTHPEVKEYMDENVRIAKEQGYVMTILGRKRYIQEIRSANIGVRSFGERAAKNMPLQGSSADIIKIAMLRVANRLKREGLRAKLVLQVHDELVLDTPLEERDVAARILKEEMENAIQLKVPLIAEVSMGRNWYDAK